ncbi:phosphatase PAP2 family protein [Shewanella subflava]|uniref:undecaprenyl-diphosphate phosphatase n=1 Tax=Shewanella subflava TaxID=2986476 RepID=A0ABT3I9V3_9GAMM|nr:phosphatase PAP2 family protein [Shewanella subflava]MCW3172846.1 phosphatase PAP2 family protein [Shewanella subflava]
MNLINKVDQYLFYCIIDFTRKQRLSTAALNVSSTGDGHWYVYISVTMLLMQAQGQQFFNLLLLSFIIELPLYLVFKNAIRRQRPCYALVDFNGHFEPSDKFSLPSGHTAGAFVMASVIHICFPVLAPLAYLWALTVGLSRIALGVHYPLDIVAGMGLGIGSVMLTQRIV